MNPDVPPDIAREDFCCDRLFDALHQLDLHDNQIRELQVFNKGYQWVQRIDFCPFCGTKRPSSLAEEWTSRLDALDDARVWEDDTRIPEHLRSDAWWKKENL